MPFAKDPSANGGRNTRPRRKVRINLVEQAKEIEEIFHKAVQHELSIHKRMGNPIAVWQDDKVVLIPPDQIQLDEP